MHFLMPHRNPQKSCDMPSVCEHAFSVSRSFHGYHPQLSVSSKEVVPFGTVALPDSFRQTLWGLDHPEEKILAPTFRCQGRANLTSSSLRSDTNLCITLARMTLLPRSSHVRRITHTHPMKRDNSFGQIFDEAKYTQDFQSDRQQHGSLAGACVKLEDQLAKNNDTKMPIRIILRVYKVGTEEIRCVTVINAVRC